jgi:hypothetical protein
VNSVDLGSSLGLFRVVPGDAPPTSSVVVAGGSLMCVAVASIVMGLDLGVSDERSLHRSLKIGSSSVFLSVSSRMVTGGPVLVDSDSWYILYGTCVGVKRVVWIYFMVFDPPLPSSRI